MKQNMQLDMSQTEPVSCDNCGHLFFKEALALRSVSRFMTGTGQPGIVPIPVFVCNECGHCNSQFMPQEVDKMDLDSDN